MSEGSQIRRWPRYPVDLPVRVTYSQYPKIVIPGRVTDISEGGMMLCPGMDFEPGDLIEIEFQTAGFPNLVSLVRCRTEQGFGLEFLTVLPTDEGNFWEEPPPWLSAIAEGAGGRIESIPAVATPVGQSGLAGSATKTIANQAGARRDCSPPGGSRTAHRTGGHPRGAPSDRSLIVVFRHRQELGIGQKQAPGLHRGLCGRLQR